MTSFRTKYQNTKQRHAKWRPSYKPVGPRTSFWQTRATLSHAGERGIWSLDSLQDLIDTPSSRWRSILNSLRSSFAALRLGICRMAQGMDMEEYQDDWSPSGSVMEELERKAVGLEEMRKAVREEAELNELLKRQAVSTATSYHLEVCF